MKRSALSPPVRPERLRVLAEIRIARQPDDLVSTLPDDKLGHELQVHRHELEIQNEELRRLLAELEEARDRYFELYDDAPVGYVTLNAEGFVTEANRTCANMLRTDLARLFGTRFAQHVAPDDIEVWGRFVETLLQGDGAVNTLLILNLHAERRLVVRLDGVRASVKGATQLRLTLSPA